MVHASLSPAPKFSDGIQAIKTGAQEIQENASARSLKVLKVCIHTPTFIAQPIWFSPIRLALPCRFYGYRTAPLMSSCVSKFQSAF